MDYIIASLLFINIIVCMFRKKPLGLNLNFTLTVKHEEPATATTSIDTEEAKVYEEMQGLIGALNDYIEKGGNVNEG